MERKTSQISLRLDPELFDAIDRARGQVPRERWVRELVIAAVALPEGPVPQVPSVGPPVTWGVPTDTQARASLNLSRQERLNRAKRKDKP